MGTAVEAGGCAPPIIIPDVKDRIREYLHGEADYDPLRLLRDAREEIQQLECAARMALQAAEKSQDAAASDARDARLWRGLISSARIRVLGWAGLKGSTRVPPESSYAHIGLELWTIHDAGSNEDSVERLTQYAEKAAAMLEATA